MMKLQNRLQNHCSQTSIKRSTLRNGDCLVQTDHLIQFDRDVNACSICPKKKGNLQCVGTFELKVLTLIPGDKHGLNST